MLKIIASNTLAQLVAKFVGASLTLFTTYFTIRLAGLDLYGDLTKILVLVAVGFTAIDFGLNAQGVRSAKNPTQMQENTRGILRARLALSLAAIIILNLLVWVLPGGYSSEVKTIFWLGSLAIIFQGIYTSTNAYFQYTLSYWRSTISVILGSVVGTALTLYFLATSPTLLNLIIAPTLGYFTMAAIALLLSPRALFSSSSARVGILPLLRHSLILGSILILSVVASKFDTIVLGVFRASGEVGQYGFAYRIFDVVLVFPVFVMNAVYPLFIKERSRGQDSRLIYHSAWAMAGLGLLGALVLWVIAPLITYVRPDLDLAIQVLRLLAITLPLFYVTAPLMWGLIGLKKDKSVLVMYLLAALLNIGLSLVFIPQYGALAAAINTGITELFILLCLLYYTKKIPFT